MTYQNPLVTIITITRNRADLISRAISSILSQSYQNFEYIIVNGASNDNTIEVVESFKDNRVKLVNLDSNLSTFQSFNIGYKISKGDYVTFLDDDDEYLPEKIRKQVELIETLSEEYGFVYCWMDYFDSKTQSKIREHHPKLRGYVANLVVEKPVVSGTPTFFFRRSCFEKLGGWKDNIGIISDWELAARCCQTWKVDYVPESLVNVYVNHNSVRMSNSKYYTDFKERRIKFHLYFLEEFKNIFDKYPKKKNYHLHALASSYFLLGKWKEGWGFYKNLLNNTITVKYLLLPPYCFIKRILQNETTNR